MTSVMDFPSTGIPIAVIAQEATSLALSDLERRYARAFFVRHSVSTTGPRVPMRTQPGLATGETTGEIVVLVLPVRRRPTSEHPFIAIGRLEGNDIALVDETVSKFHAYVKEQPDATYVVQDARSRNGTTVEGQPVAQRGMGPPTPLAFGQTVRFGSVTTTFMDAKGVVALAQRMTRA